MPESQDDILCSWMRSMGMPDPMTGEIEPRERPSGSKWKPKKKKQPHSEDKNNKQDRSKD